MSDDVPRPAHATDFGDEGQRFDAHGLTLVHPEGWLVRATQDRAAEVPLTTVYLTAPEPSTAFMALQLLGLSLDGAARDGFAATVRKAFERGMPDGLDTPPVLARQHPTAATFLGAQRPGQHLAYAGTLEGRELEVEVDLFAATLEEHTAVLLAASHDEDRSELVHALALVAATLEIVE